MVAAGHDAGAGDRRRDAQFGTSSSGSTDMGTLEAGKSADFIVLDANPLDDITNTRRISAVLPARTPRFNDSVVVSGSCRSADQVRTSTPRRLRTGARAHRSFVVNVAVDVERRPRIANEAIPEVEAQRHARRDPSFEAATEIERKRPYALPPGCTAAAAGRSRCRQ